MAGALENGETWAGTLEDEETWAGALKTGETYASAFKTREALGLEGTLRCLRALLPIIKK